MTAKRKKAKRPAPKREREAAPAPAEVKQEAAQGSKPATVEMVRPEQPHTRFRAKRRA